MDPIFSCFGLLRFHFFCETSCGGFFLPFGLFWVFALCFSGCIGSKAVDERNNDLLDVDLRMETSRGRQESSKRV